MFVLFKYFTWLLSPLAIVLIVLWGSGLYLSLTCKLTLHPQTLPLNRSRYSIRRLIWMIRWIRYIRITKDRRLLRLGIVLCLTGAGLTLWSLPWMTLQLGLPLENAYPILSIEATPQADAIVVLGGGVGATTERVPFPELYSAGDRVIHAVRLYMAGKAPIIIPSGAGASKQEVPLMRSLNVPDEAILLEGRSIDTAENGRYTMELLAKRGAKRCLLVTSSWHMKRSMMLFKNDKIEVIPVGCDYETTRSNDVWSRMMLWQKLPSPQSLLQNSILLKEYLGIAFYSIFKKKTL